MACPVEQPRIGRSSVLEVFVKLARSLGLKQGAQDVEAVMRVIQCAHMSARCHVVVIHEKRAAVMKGD